MKNYSFFPFDKFRPYQKEILDKAVEALEEGTEVVIIDAPPGFGKSGVNIALARQFGSSFYTTPQVKLVEQLNRDFGQEKLAVEGGVSDDIVTLLGRNKYICKHSKEASDVCYVRNDPNYSCLDVSNCTYWKQKEATMNANVAIITFANLIVNKYLPEYIKGRQISFKKRNLLIVDECQSLEGQVAGMFCGFKIYQNSFRLKYKLKKEKSYTTDYTTSWFDFLKKIPKFRKENYYIIANIYVEFIEYIKQEFEKLLKTIIDLLKDDYDVKTSKESVKNRIQQIEYLLDDINKERIWIVNENKKDDVIINLEFKPIDIDRFLQEMVWSYADQLILSSATIPYQDKIENWLKRIGLEDRKYIYLFAPSIFPIENRPIVMDYMGGRMTKKYENKSFDSNVYMCKKIMEKHQGERGVIHSTSYNRAENIYEDLYGKNLFLHSNENNQRNIIDSWNKSKKQCLLSPSVYEGVDLKDDLCRFQILFKIPYPSIVDGRVSYLLNRRKDWEWYWNETIMKIVQMYGRAVRHEKDYATFYTVDGSFMDLLKKSVKFPQWFLEAIKK